MSRRAEAPQARPRPFFFFFVFSSREIGPYWPQDALPGPRARATGCPRPHRLAESLEAGLGQGRSWYCAPRPDYGKTVLGWPTGHGRPRGTGERGCH